MNNNQIENQIDLQKEREELGKEKPKAKDTARLVWASKPKKEPTAKDLDFQTAEEVYPNKEDISNENKKLNTFWAETKDVDNDPNRVIWGDNFLVMKALLAKGYEGQIDLIYIDPPFNTGENFNFVNEVQIGDKKFDKELTISERLAYTDTWKRGVDSFLDMLYPRLQLMRKLLSEKGAIFVHCDANVSHYIKIIMDEIFKKNNFRNEIIVRRIRKNIKERQRVPRMNVGFDSVLFYSTGPEHLIKPPMKEDKKEDRWHSFEASGIRTGMDYELFGHVPKSGNHWRWSKERSDKAISEGTLRQNPSTGKPEYFIPASTHVLRDNLWEDITAYSFTYGYPTEKKEDFIEQIIEMSSNKGELVADFFCGSGTTVAVAEKLGRKWITSDLSKTAIQVTRSRLVHQEAEPFLIQNLGNYQRQLIYSNEVNLKEMYTIILKLYGADPRKDRQAFGISKSDKSTLVYVCEPDRPMMADKALSLAREAKNMDGKGYRRIVILAWDYEMGFDQDWKRITAKKKDVSDIEFKIIPSDVYKYLRSTKVGDPEISAKIIFYQKPYLKLGQPKKVLDSGDSTAVTVNLERYVVFDIPVEDETKKPEIDGLLRKNFAYLIDYWTVDWDYDGMVFRSSWQAIKERRNSEPVSTIAETTLKKGKRYQIAVRVVDVFGNDAFGIEEIDLR